MAFGNATKGDLKKISGGGGSGGTSNYNDLSNKPSINGVTLSGNKSSSDLHISASVNFTDVTTEITTGDGIDITTINGLMIVSKDVFDRLYIMPIPSACITNTRRYMNGYTVESGNNNGTYCILEASVSSNICNITTVDGTIHAIYSF